MKLEGIPNQLDHNHTHDVTVKVKIEIDTVTTQHLRELIDTLVIGASTVMTVHFTQRVIFEVFHKQLWRR